MPIAAHDLSVGFGPDTKNAFFLTHGTEDAAPATFVAPRCCDDTYMEARLAPSTLQGTGKAQLA